MSDKYYKSIEEVLPALYDYQQSLFEKFDKANYELINRELSQIALTIGRLNQMYDELKKNQDGLLKQLGVKNHA
jgi:hypothetical protein